MAYDSINQALESSGDLAYTHHTRPPLSCQALWLLAEGDLYRLDLLDLQESQAAGEGGWES